MVGIKNTFAIGRSIPPNKRPTITDKSILRKQRDCTINDLLIFHCSNSIFVIFVELDREIFTRNIGEHAVRHFFCFITINNDFAANADSPQPNTTYGSGIFFQNNPFHPGSNRNIATLSMATATNGSGTIIPLSINSPTTNQDIATFAVVNTANTRRRKPSLNSNYATTNFYIATGMMPVTATNASSITKGRTNIKRTRAINNQRVAFRYINTGVMLAKRLYKI